MAELSYLPAALFLPLFPLSLVFNVLFARLRWPWVRALLLLAWPQIGLWLLFETGTPVPGWLSAWAIFTAALYGFRALALREVGLWTGFMATSAWALLWVPVAAHMGESAVRYDALGFSAPLVLLVLLAAGLEQRFGAAYAGLYGGLAQTIPRFSGVLVMVVLAVIASPLSPGFFTLLTTIVAVSPAAAFALVIVWLLWSWAGALLLQGLIVGPAHDEPAADMTLPTTWGYALLLGVLMVGGVYLTGDLL